MALVLHLKAWKVVQQERVQPSPLELVLELPKDRPLEQALVVLEQLEKEALVPELQKEKLEQVQQVEVDVKELLVPALE